MQCVMIDYEARGHYKMCARGHYNMCARGHCNMCARSHYKMCACACAVLDDSLFASHTASFNLGSGYVTMSMFCGECELDFLIFCILIESKATSKIRLSIISFLSFDIIKNIIKK